MQDNKYMIDSLMKQRNDIDNMIENYKAMPPSPASNILNNIQMQDNIYEVKRLNENDEVENIAVFKNTIFLCEDRMQIKKLDGTIEKYDITKTFPKDKRDYKIEELTNKIAELERRLANECTELNEPIKTSNKSKGNANGDVESKSVSTSESNAESN